MKTRTVNIYSFSELSDKSKEVARNTFRETIIDSDWAECMIDAVVDQGQLMGISFKERQVPLMGGGKRGEPYIWWSGFCSQGDGACFEGSWKASDVQADKVAEGWGDDPSTTELKRIAGEFKQTAEMYPYARFDVSHSGHYYHANSTDFDVNLHYYSPEEERDVTPSEEQDARAVIEDARDFMRWIYSQLESAYDHETSDEQVDDQLENCGFEFTEDGSMA